MPDNKISKCEIDSEVFRIYTATEKALIIVQEITDGYFFKYNIRKDANRKDILYDFEKNRLYADIISDYLIEIRLKLEEINSKVEFYNPDNY